MLVLRSSHLLAGALLLGGALLASCGARSSLPGDEIDAALPDASPDGATGQRSCPFECAVGHECCQGGCFGPAVEMPSDCCTCLPGEVNSMQCPSGRCEP